MEIGAIKIIKAKESFQLRPKYRLKNPLKEILTVIPKEYTFGLQLQL
jgi:hypothetical protein